MITLRGITWEHRRAVDPLRATLDEFRARHGNIDVQWESRALSGFEFQSVGELARQYDLIIFDHPFVGAIAAHGYLMPLDEILADAGDRFVGPSLGSYRFDKQTWGLPVDAACQVAVARPDLMIRLRPVPRTWEEVLALGECARGKGLSLAIGLERVHALMTFFTIMAGLGEPCAVEPEQPFCNHTTARDALWLLRALVRFCPKSIFTMNSIRLHDAMVAAEDIVYCPAVYCYATYAEADQRRPLRFFDLPGVLSASPKASAIGGTGLGISANCTAREEAFAYARYLLEPSTQTAFASHHGQPARVECWEDRGIDERFGGCFRNTRASIELAWIRPRYNGYLAFQAAAGPLVERHLRGELAEKAMLAELDTLHARGVGGEA